MIVPKGVRSPYLQVFVILACGAISGCAQQKAGPMPSLALEVVRRSEHTSLLLQVLEARGLTVDWADATVGPLEGPEYLSDVYVLRAPIEDGSEFIALLDQGADLVESVVMRTSGSHLCVGRNHVFEGSAQDCAAAILARSSDSKGAPAFGGRIAPQRQAQVVGATNAQEAESCIDYVNGTYGTCTDGVAQANTCIGVYLKPGEYWNNGQLMVPQSVWEEHQDAVAANIARTVSMRDAENSVECQAAKDGTWWGKAACAWKRILAVSGVGTLISSSSVKERLYPLLDTYIKYGQKAGSEVAVGGEPACGDNMGELASCRFVRGEMRMDGTYEWHLVIEGGHPCPLVAGECVFNEAECSSACTKPVIYSKDEPPGCERP